MQEIDLMTEEQRDQLWNERVMFQQVLKTHPTNHEALFSITLIELMLKVADLEVAIKELQADCRGNK